MFLFDAIALRLRRVTHRYVTVETTDRSAIPSAYGHRRAMVRRVLHCLAATLTSGVIAETRCGVASAAESQSPNASTGFAVDALPSLHRLHAVTPDALHRMSDAIHDALHVDLYVNDRFVGNERIAFGVPNTQPTSASTVTTSRSPTPCFERDTLVRAGVDEHKLDRQLASIGDDRIPAQCHPLSMLSSDAVARLDIGELRLDVSIPQAWMRPMSDAVVDRSRWDPGIPALFASYALELSRSRELGRSQVDAAVDLATGLNLGYWHWRQRGRVEVERFVPIPGGRYRAFRSYVERPVPGLDAWLRLGQIDTASLVLARSSMIGVTLASDDRMLGDTTRGYAPVIRGIALSRSTIVVTQGTRTLLDTVVPAGPFEIVDLRPVANLGPLDMVVTPDRLHDAQNGHAQRAPEHTWIAAATLPRMIRAGAHRFAFSAGWPMHGVKRTLLIDVSARDGLDNRLTAQGGIQWTPRFLATGVGLAINTLRGAWTADVDTGFAGSPFAPRAAQWRLGFVAARGPKSPAWSASVAMRVGKAPLDLHAWLAETARVQAKESAAPIVTTAPTRVRASHREARRAARAWFINAMISDAWRTRVAWHASTSLQLVDDATCGHCSTSALGVELGVATRIGLSSVSVTLAHSRAIGRPLRFTQLAVDLRAPLGQGRYAPTLSAEFVTDDVHTLSRRWTLTGAIKPRLSFGRDDASGNPTSDDDDGDLLGYAIASACDGSVKDARAAPSSSLSASSFWALPRSIDACLRRPSAQFAYRDASGDAHVSIVDGRMASIRRAGSVVFHRNGVTWGAATAAASGDTIALLDTQGIPGLHVIGATNVRSDGQGFALVPSLRPYRPNSIDIDPERIPHNVTSTGSTREVVPIPGAVVRVRVNATRKASHRWRIVRSDGASLPPGGVVVDATETVIARIGRHGRLRFLFDGNVHDAITPSRMPLRIRYGASMHCVVSTDRLHDTQADLHMDLQTDSTADTETTWTCDSPATE